MKIAKQSCYEIVGINTEMGFAHVITDEDVTIQCCLEQKKNQKGYKKSVNKEDSGFDDGICGEVNEKAFKKYGKEKCLEFLLKELRKQGVRIN